MESSLLTSCPHLQQIVNTEGLERLSRAAEIVFSLANRPVTGITKESVLKCLHPDCNLPVLSDLYVCVHCVHVACSARPRVRPLAPSASPSINKSPSPASGHVLAHQKASGHPLYLSVDHGQIFCVSCKDFVFDPYVDTVISLQANHARALRCRFNSALPAIDPPTSDNEPTGSSNYTLCKSRQKRRRLVNQRDWVPTKKELELIAAHSALFSNARGVVRPPVGLYNLGNSCYMNSVLQAFLNAPPLRHFFLADDHKPNCQRESRLDCFACALEALVCESCFTSEGKQPTKEKGNGSSGGNIQVPFLVPQMILDIVWRNADHLASYAQHDAHEFLICALNLLNTHCRLEATEEKKKEKGEPVLVQINLRKESPMSRAVTDAKRDNTSTTASPVANIRLDSGGEPNTSDVLSGSFNNSIVQRLFSGTLQSDVICRVCGNSSPTLEKFYDISLDVDKFLKPSLNRRGRTSSPAGDTSSRVKHSGAAGTERGKGKHDGKTERDEQNGSDSTKQSPHKSGNSGDMEGEKGSDSVNTLHECLARFTDPEMLGSSSKMHCMTCGTRQEAMKQMSICTLPPIVCFHFKRFEQSFASVRRSEMVKIDTPVEFPADGLNLTTFLTSEVLRKRTETDSKGKGTRPNSREAKPKITSKRKGEDKVRENEQTIYDLFAVVNHVGKIDSGHYTALVRRDGTWFRCDDEKVSLVGDVEQVVRSEEAYLVFYMQRYPNIQY